MSRLNLRYLYFLCFFFLLGIMVFNMEFTYFCLAITLSFIVIVGVLILNKTYIVVVLISLLLLLGVSPIWAIYFLFLPTIYFLYRGSSFKDIFKVWGWFFCSWYLLFTSCLIGYDFPIWIGDAVTSEETNRLYIYIKDTFSFSRFGLLYPIPGGFCIQTFLFLEFLSKKWGICFYIPSVFKGLWVLGRAIGRLFSGGGGSAECSPEKSSGSSKPSGKKGPVQSGPSPRPSSGSPSGFKDFWGKLTQKKKSSHEPLVGGKTRPRNSMDSCGDLKSDYLGKWGPQMMPYYSDEVITEENRVKFTKVNLLFFRIENCRSVPLTKMEKELFKAKKK